MIKKEVLSILILVFLSLGFVSGSIENLGTFKQNEEILLLQLCSDCTFNNITLVTDPNSSELIRDVVMTQNETVFSFLLTKNLTSQAGTYNVNGLGDIGGVNTIWAYTLQVTPTGAILNTSESLIFIILTAAVFFFFILSFYFAIVIPYANEVNDKGMVFKVTKLKYVKLLFIMISYSLFVWFLNTLIGLSSSFSSLTLFLGLMSFLFTTLINLSWPFGIFILVLALFEVIRDANIQKNIRSLMGAMR